MEKPKTSKVPRHDFGATPTTNVFAMKFYDFHSEKHDLRLTFIVENHISSCGPHILISFFLIISSFDLSPVFLLTAIQLVCSSLLCTSCRMYQRSFGFRKHEELLPSIFKNIYLIEMTAPWLFLQFLRYLSSYFFTSFTVLYVFFCITHPLTNFLPNTCGVPHILLPILLST